MKALFSNPSTRPVVFLTGGLLIGLLGLGYFGMSKTANEDIESSASVGKGPTVVHQPGASTSASHAALQEEANRRKLEEDRNKARTSLPVLTSGQNVNEPLRLPDGSAQPVQPVQQVPTTTIPSMPPATTLPPAPASSALPAEIPQAAAPAVVSDAMNKQIVGYLNLWGPGSKQFQEYVYIKQSPKAGSDEPVSALNANLNGSALNQQAAQAANQQAAAQQAAEASKIRFVRAGTTVPAQLITPLNSDAPGPVLAQITTGPLAGARLIGTMSVRKDTLLVSFSSISKPGWPDMYSVSAVGMNQDNSTGLATDVNKHYMNKYLALLGGSFLNGYGRGMQQQGQVAVITDSGNVVSEQNELNSRQIAKVAQGEVAQEIGDAWKRSGDRDATIKVEGKDGAPYEIQILFLRNF